MGDCTTYAYARVSTVEQNLARQMEAFAAHGVDKANIFFDKMSGSIEHRPALDSLLGILEPGDTLVVMSFDRLARSTRQLLELSERFQRMGVSLVSIKESLDTSTPQGKLFFTISSAFAEFERAIIRERQAEGIAVAKAEGRYSGRPRMDIDEGSLNLMVHMESLGEITAKEAARRLGVSDRTYRRRRDELASAT